MLPYTWTFGITPVLVMPNYTSLNYVFKLPSHILLRLLTYSLLAANTKLPSFYYSPLSTTAIFLHKNFTHWLSKNSLLPHTEKTLHLTNVLTNSLRANSFFTGQFHKTPINLYETFTSKNAHFTHTRCFTMIHEKFYRAKQGKLQGVSGQIYFFRAKTIWPPMFSYVSWKVPFSQIIVFLRVNFKIGKFFRASLTKIFANTKLFFEFFVKLQLKWMCFCHFWKCGHFSLTDTRCFIMPNCIKNTIFVNLCGGIQRCTFKLASMYYMRVFLIYTLLLKHK